MTNNQTLEKMNSMKLFGLSRAFKTLTESGMKNNYTIEELVAHLIDAEWDDKQNRKLTRLLKAAKFRYKAAMEEIDFSIPRNLDKKGILQLMECNWIQKKKNIIITGSTGTGKSYIACAIGNQACIYGYRVLYMRIARLFPLLKMSKADGTYLKKIEKIQKQELLILDDFGLEHLDTENRLSLLEIIEDRYKISSTIFISQLPVKKWHDVIGDPTIADAILDRLVHNSIKIDLKSKESVRKNFK
jgi:DNA replication protein DnaC